MDKDYNPQDSEGKKRRSRNIVADNTRTVVTSSDKRSTDQLFKNVVDKAIDEQRALRKATDDYKSSRDKAKYKRDDAYREARIIARAHGEQSLAANKALQDRKKNSVSPEKAKALLKKVGVR